MLLLIYLINFITIAFITNAQNICVNKETCGDCIQEPGCGWCPNEDLINSPHCFQAATSEFTKCLSSIISPDSISTVMKDKPIQVQPNLEPVQITPQVVNLKLRKGEVHVLPFQFAQARNFPIDLYYLMDLSASMLAHKDNLAKLGTEIVHTMRNITSNFRIGFGSFVDKTEMPFVSTVPEKLITPCRNCEAPYSFRNHMSLANGETFAAEVRRAKVSGNLDAPEGGFDALMQAMVCNEEIGWREQARHIIVFSTDAGFHIAGDGKLAGVVEPNDANCHMAGNHYTDALIYDYPSISHINQIASEKQINIFFAISDKSGGTFELYKKLKAEIANSNIAKLSKDSDLSKLLADYYNSISDKVQIKDNADADVEIQYEANCDEIPNGCKAVQVGKTIHFEAKIKPLKCANKTIVIQPTGLIENITVNLEVICDCNCEQTQNSHNAELCHFNGQIQCGICKCNIGHYGKSCECNGDNDFVEDVSSCKLNNNTEICTGLGICKCGGCECEKRQDPNQKIYGKYCECDNYSCPKMLDKLCNGRGTCECGECVCHAGWTGESCNCPNNNETCTRSNQVCSDHGNCVCGECHCERGYYGKFCEECTTCVGRRCEELKPCVECRVFESGKYKDECDLKCSQYVIEKVDKINDIDSEDVKICRFQDECITTFKYSYVNDQDIQIEAEKEKNCPIPLNIPVLVFGLIGGILLAGIIMLLIWKVATDIHDKREYAKFENEKVNSKWNANENPLFKIPVGKYENPLYKK